ncbi:MAG: hypothetical protein K9I85_05095 [Saprospiraceae bacterium]|nr:hypothetical protein [Saprospiraceae bacterium]
MIPLVFRWLPFFWQSFPRAGKLVLIVYLGTNLLSGFLAGEFNGMLEAIGRVYLAIVFLLGWMFAIRGGRHSVRQAVKMWCYGAFIMASLSLVGYVLGYLGWLNETVALYEQYPYLGTVLRASGFTGGPGMLIIVLIPPLLFSWHMWQKDGKIGLFLLLIGISFLTFSKEIVLVLTALLWMPGSSLTKRLRSLATGLVVIIYIVGTHVLVTRDGGMNDALGNTDFTSDITLLHIGHTRILETSYLTLKRTAFRIGSAKPWFGIGPGNFQEKVALLKKEGLYPAHLPVYEPHSTWMGGFAELGVVGLGCLFAFSIWLLRWLYNGRGEIWSHSESRILLIYVVTILVISISMDVLNFRHLWLPLGLLAGIVSRSKIGSRNT